MEDDEQSPEDEAKQEESGDKEEENQTEWTMLAGYKTYLVLSKTFLTFAILLIKFLRQKKWSDISGWEVYQVSYFLEQFTTS